MEQHHQNNRPKMTTGDRAKQFAPFAAVTGLDKALRLMEKQIVPQPVLSDESLNELDEAMKILSKNDMVEVIYYSNGECIKISGMVAKIEPTSRILQIVNTRISFDNILSIKPLQNHD